MEKRFCALVVSLLITLSLSGCYPHIFYPEVLKQGVVNNGTYTTRVGNGGYNIKFRIMIPQDYNKYEIHFMKTREYYGSNFTYLSFGPIAGDDTVYRLLVVYKDGMPLEQFRELYLPMFVDMSVRGFDRQWHMILHEYTEVNMHPAIYDIYMQSLPTMYQYYNWRQTNDVRLTHAIHFVDYGCVGVIFWVQPSSGSGMYPVTWKNRYQLIHQRYKPQTRFLRSFVLNPLYTQWELSERQYYPIILG